MTQLTDQDLREILADTESIRSERKAFWGPTVAPKAREAVCAFANDLTGTGRAGVLIIGARDDGSPSGISVDDKLLIALTDMRSDGNIVPPPSMYVERRTLDGYQYAVVVVEPSDSPPVRYQGRIWVRTGPRRDTATEQDERILNERRQARMVSEDLRPITSATLEDINEGRFNYFYLPKAFDKSVLEANNRTMLERLTALKLVALEPPHHPTLMGCLALVDDATRHVDGAYIQWLKIDGTAVGAPIIDQLASAGDVQQAIARIDARFDAHTPTEVDYGKTPLERRFSPYPVDALQELLRNAVMHRSYFGGNAPVRVYWFSDRVEIINSGGPYGDVSVHNFGVPGITGYRNPNLAEAMRVLGLVQRFGTGIGFARSRCAENGNPPIEFDVTQTYVRAVVRPAVRPW